MAYVRFEPFNLGRWILWSATAVLFVVAPHVFTQGFALTMMTQMGAFIIFALSYNMLLGQGGMLSFGHAVYSGLGAFFTIHALNLVSSGALSDLYSATLAQIGPILPYLLMVLILIFRPTGLLGKREV